MYRLLANLALLFICLLSCIDVYAIPLTLDGYVKATTNYISKAVTNTEDDPALQGQVKLTTDPGFYGYIWASNVKFDTDPDAFMEIDLGAGYSQQFGDLDLDLGYVYYAYPKSPSIAYGDAYVFLQYLGFELDSYVSNNISNEGKFGGFYHLSYNLDLPRPKSIPMDKFTLSPGVGRYQRHKIAGGNYNEIDISVAVQRGKFEFAVAYANAEGGRRTNLHESSLYAYLTYYFSTHTKNRTKR